MTAGESLPAAIAAIAVVISLAALKYSRDSAKAAVRSADVAEKSARRADADQDDSGEDPESEAELARSVVWRLRRRSTVVVELWNDGERDALSVEVQVQLGFRVEDLNPPPGYTVGAGTYLLIGCASVPGHPDPTVNVLWKLDPGGMVFQAQRLVPPLPGV